MKVKKRDGRLCEYDRDKIRTAIQKANKEVEENEEGYKELSYTSSMLDTKFIYGVIKWKAVKHTYDLNGDLQPLKICHDTYDHTLK